MRNVAHIDNDALYPQLADADLPAMAEDGLLDLAELVLVDLRACPRADAYLPADHGLALDVDKVRDELNRRGIVRKLDQRWGIFASIQRALWEHGIY